jgi:hypothetical protein
MQPSRAYLHRKLWLQVLEKLPGGCCGSLEGRPLSASMHVSVHACKRGCGAPGWKRANSSENSLGFVAPPVTSTLPSGSTTALPYTRAFFMPGRLLTCGFWCALLMVISEDACTSTHIFHKHSLHKHSCTSHTLTYFTYTHIYIYCVMHAVAGCVALVWITHAVAGSVGHSTRQSSMHVEHGGSRACMCSMRLGDAGLRVHIAQCMRGMHVGKHRLGRVLHHRKSLGAAAGEDLARVKHDCVAVGCIATWARARLVDIALSGSAEPVHLDAGARVEDCTHAYMCMMWPADAPVCCGTRYMHA